MATVNGKVYTDHPMMDEMIYNLNIIMNQIVVKDQTKADEEETQETLDNSAVYLSIINAVDRFETFPFNKKMLQAFGYDSLQATIYSNNRDKIPIDEREDLFRFCEEYFVDNYEEKNNYYRTLAGIPPYGSGDKFYVKATEDMFNDPESIELLDLSTPVHLFEDYQISIMEEEGVLDRLWSLYSGDEYQYLKHLGHRKVDIFKAREASKWDILYIPSVDQLVENRFKEIFLINKQMYLQRYDTMAYQVVSDYYEEILIVMLLGQTYTDMISDIPEWYVRRDVFDLRSCQYFIESQGVKFFKQIPLKFQVNIVRNLNKLIRYKSTNKNVWDIIDLFGYDNVTAYKYYLLKKRKMNGKHYVTDPDNNQENMYDMEFVKTPIGTTYDNTIKDNIYRTPYDDITYEDKYWDGEREHSLVRTKHVEKDYTIEGTKVMSLDMLVSMKDFQFQMEYFIGLLLDSNLDTGDVTIRVPTISATTSFRVSDLFLLLYCMSSGYEEFSTNIDTPGPYPTEPKPDFYPYDLFDGGSPETTDFYEVDGEGVDINRKYRTPVNGGDKPEYTEQTQESFYDWMRWKYPYFWDNNCNKVFGFNMNADLDELKEMIGVRHSTFGWDRGWTLEELGVDGFLNTKDINSIPELVNIYHANKEAYDNLYMMITDKASTRDDLVVFNFVFNYLFLRDFDIKRYTLSDGSLAKTMVDVLKDRNRILYHYYKTLVSETDKETRQDQLRNAMNDIVNTLNYYINDPDLKDAFAFCTISSFDSVLKYIFMMVNFFKSYKVYYLDPYVTYALDNKFDNKAYMMDVMEEIKEDYWRTDHFTYADTVLPTIDEHAEDSFNQDYLKEVVDILQLYECDPDFDLELDGGHVTDDIPRERDIDGGEVDLLSYSPYNMINGGKVGKGWHLWDLDGGGPEEHLEYLDVNGKYPDTIWGEQGALTLGFNVDGGHPSVHMFTTRSIRVRIVDNQIVASVSIYANSLNLVEDRGNGLILSTDRMVTEEDIDLLRSDMKDTIQYYSHGLNDDLDLILLIGSEEYRDNYIYAQVDKCFENAYKVINAAQTEEPLNNAKAYADKKVKELNDLFDKFSILGWGTF